LTAAVNFSFALAAMLTISFSVLSTSLDDRQVARMESLNQKNL